MFIDTHAHLYDSQFSVEEQELLIQKILFNGVSQVLLPNVDVDTIETMKLLTQKYPYTLKMMMGLHPCSVKASYQEELAIIKDELFTNQDNYIAIGEIGLDYYWDTTFKEEQISCFEEQIKWAITLNKPIAIHTRNSFLDSYNIVKDLHNNKLSGVFHCFSGNYQEALQVLELNSFYLGIGGVLTFKNSGLKEAIKDIPLERLVLETDSPYLAPVPHRGKRNESSYLPIIATELAILKGVSIEKVATITSQNAKKLFRL